MTTPAARSPNAAYAIARAKAGHPVVPLCAVVDGRCGFPKHCGGSWDATQRRHVAHEGRDIGKAPISALVPHGYKDASTSLAKVTTWWLKYPLANVGEPHEANGWVTVDPDTDPAQAEAHKLGLGPTLIRKSRQPAFIYQRPANCPATSVKKRGKSEAIDVLADGYLVTFGLHKDGHRIELVGDTVAAAPAWAVEWLQKAAAERETKRSAGVGPGIGDDDEPPVLLDEYGLKVWRGELFKAHPDGSVERSGSLVKLGRVLYDAGATRRTVVLALAERDEALGWRKFTGRADAEQQYLAIFVELERNGRNARTSTLSPAAPTPESADQQAAVEEAEQITKGEGEDLVCIPRSTYEQLLARATEADRQQAVIQSQRATIAEYHTIQRQEREIFASSLPPAQKLADWAILNVVTAKVSRSDDEQPLYAEEVARLCNVSRDIIGRRLEAQAALGVFTKTTKWDTARLVVNDRTGEIRPPRVTRIKPLVSVSEAWDMVAQAAATAPARKRAPVRCELHPTGPIQRTCMAPVGNGAVCGRLLGEDPLFAPHADVGVDAVPEVLPQESAIPPTQRRRGSSGPSMPQESAIPEDFGSTLEDVLGSPDAPIGEPPEEPPDDETRERWRREHYRERYDHAPPPPSPANGSANGHHPPPAARSCITAGCDAPLRPDQAFLCDRHRAKNGPPPSDGKPDAVTIRTEKVWRDAGIDVAKLRAAQAAGVDIMAAARATGIEGDAAALAAVFPAPRTAELPIPPAHNQEGGQPAFEQ